MFTKHVHKPRLANTGDVPQVKVVPHLAMTPTDVAKAIQQGKPVSQANNDSMYFDGVEEKDAMLDLEFTRGYDINVAWDQEITSRENIRKGRNAFKQIQELKNSAGDNV